MVMATNCWSCAQLEKLSRRLAVATSAATLNHFQFMGTPESQILQAEGRATLVKGGAKSKKTTIGLRVSAVVQAGGLGHQIILFRDAGGSAGGDPIVPDGVLAVARHFEQVGADRVRPFHPLPTKWSPGSSSASTTSARDARPTARRSPACAFSNGAW